MALGLPDVFIKRVFGLEDPRNDTEIAERHEDHVNGFLLVSAMREIDRGNLTQTRLKTMLGLVGQPAINFDSLLAHLKANFTYEEIHDAFILYEVGWYKFPKFKAILDL